MAVKDGSGPRPAAHRAKRCFLKCLETSFNPCFFLPSARVQQGARFDPEVFGSARPEDGEVLPGQKIGEPGDLR